MRSIYGADLDVGDHRIKLQMNSDSEEVYLPFDIGQAATQGDFERVKAWLAGGSASDPRSINARDHTDWTLLHWTVVSAGNDITLAHIEFARYLISQGVRVDAKSSEESTALHFACGSITGGDIAAWFLCSSPPAPR